MCPEDAAAEHTALGSVPSSSLWLYHVDSLAPRRHLSVHLEAEWYHLPTSGGQESWEQGLHYSLICVPGKCGSETKGGSESHLVAQSPMDMRRLYLHHGVEQDLESCSLLLADFRTLRDSWRLAVVWETLSLGSGLCICPGSFRGPLSNCFGFLF